MSVGRKLIPALDGVEHVNIYSRGRTVLGRWMSNFARQPMVLPEHGSFESVEGFWYWLGTRDDRLRRLSGFEAKKLGRMLKRVVNLPEEEFKEEIIRALEAKLKAHPAMCERFRNSHLPFEHYYVFDGVVRDAGFRWLVEWWMGTRTEMQRAIEEELDVQLERELEEWQEEEVEW